MIFGFSFITILLCTGLFVAFFVGNIFVAHILFKNSPDASILRGNLAKCIFGFVNAAIDTTVVILIIYLVAK